MWPTYYIPPQVLYVEPPPPGYINNGCGTSTTFVPTNIADLRVGYFMLWICVTNTGRTWGEGAALTIPEGWEIYAADPGLRNANNSGSVIFYRWATAEDLDPATFYVSTFVSPNTNGIYRVCSVTYAYTNIHRNMPFANRNTSRASGSSDWRQTEPLFMHLGHEGSPVVLVTGSKGTDASSSAWGLQSEQPLGPVLADEQLFSLPYIVDSGYNAFYVGRRVASNTEGENWIPGETATSSVQDAGWSSFAMGLKTMANNHARLRPGGFGYGRHYIEYEVSLVAGEEYTYHLSRRGSLKSGYEGALGVSYVDSLGNERGGIVHSTTRWGSVLDPLTDYGSVWEHRTLAEREDGDPSTTGCTLILTFTAQTTGTYKLRISIARGYWNGSGYTYAWEFTPASNEYRDIRAVCFRRGKDPAYFLPTPNGPVMAGEEKNGALASCWDDFSFSAPNESCPGGVSNHLLFALNKNVELAPAVMETYWNWGDTCGLVEYNTVYATYVTSDDAAAIISSSRPVMPRINGVLQKYYYELTLLNAKHIQLGVNFAAMGGGGSYLYDTRNGKCSIPNADNNEITIGTVVSPLIGDVWGCLIDYVNKQIVFYRNNALVGSISMLDTYGVPNATNSGKTPWDIPLYVLVNNRVSPWPVQVSAASINLRGPFVHQPVGSIAFDWL
jgi:hypothetical protein